MHVTCVQLIHVKAIVHQIQVQRHVKIVVKQKHMKHHGIVQVLLSP